MTDVKALLKEAREAIKNKDYETSLKLSKLILRADKTNYMALVFLGLSLQEIGPAEQAPKAFQKAIESNSTNPLAWTGLINYYEKIDTIDSKKELIKLYSTAIDLETSEKKIIEYCEKLAKLYDYGDITDISKKIFCCCKNEKIGESNCAIFGILVNLFEKNADLPPVLQNMYEECLLHLIENKESSNANYYSAYLNLLYKQKKYEDLLCHAEKMHKLFETDTISLVWIFTSLRPGLLHAWVLLARVYVKLNLFEEATQSYLTADKLLQSINYSNKVLKELLDVLSIEILSKSSKEEDWDKALELYNVKNSELKKKCLAFVIRVNINLEKHVEAKLLILDLKSSDEPWHQPPFPKNRLTASGEIRSSWLRSKDHIDLTFFKID
ncbi:hypothetical protein NQ314_018889 [Rhamnusium bicolor]|uniref:Uncharacterized protein n=1 Tax=Rhamnusium bicolor TaxID=1586634 RepID=A0AAV8WQX5_9CUCU|nr:hypothetical protein NQ314_018889 [Rhamnusium bicolor]